MRKRCRLFLCIFRTPSRLFSLRSLNYFGVKHLIIRFKAVNRRIFTIFLWHQSALLLVVGAALALSGTQYSFIPDEMRLRSNPTPTYGHESLHKLMPAARIAVNSLERA